MPGISTERLWDLTSGILFGAGVGGHALRLVTIEGDFGVRSLIALAACLLYGVASALTFFRKKLGLWVSVIGPAVGVSAVLLTRDASVDAFQVVLGIFQAVATFLSMIVLWRSRKGPG